jgi:hypothetical protein
MKTLPTPRKVSYVVSIWREAEEESALFWRGDLQTAAGQHLIFTSLAELGGWIDPPAESAPFIPPND